jgi:hypothetical protein
MRILSVKKKGRLGACEALTVRMPSLRNLPAYAVCINRPACSSGSHSQ